MKRRSINLVVYITVLFLTQLIEVLINEGMELMTGDVHNGLIMNTLMLANCL